jgi:hypothetical protein
MSRASLNGNCNGNCRGTRITRIEKRKRHGYGNCEELCELQRQNQDLVFQLPLTKHLLLLYPCRFRFQSA